MIIITGTDARAFIQFQIKVQVTLARLTATLAALGAFVPRRHADRWQVMLVQLRLFMGGRIQNPCRAQQLRAVLVVRGVGKTAIKPELELAFATTHAAPAIKKNTGDYHYADDYQPFAQTDFHVIPCP